MSDKSARDKAIDKIYSLTKLAEHPNTPPAEAEAARNRIAALRTKYGIPETKGPSNPPPRRTHNDDVWDEMRRAKARQDAERIRKRRADMQKQWEQWARDKDRYGRPLSAEERAEAQRDPLGFAAKRDGRTNAQRNQDMGRSWGRAQAQPACAQPESFFDPGGNPRPRNQHIIDCDRCGRRLEPGEGTVLKVGGRWIGRCCETKPGPRKRRFD